MATLQIDALAEMVSLIDPRVSRDGVPLCAKHADATTPPVGWAMNDLRSGSAAPATGSVPGKVQAQSGRSLAAVPDETVVPHSTPPRVRPDRRAAVVDAHGAADSESESDGVGRAGRSTVRIPKDDLPFAHRDRRSSGPDAPSDRPSRRRDESEPEPEQGESFPWRYEFDEDEGPSELKASSPLLSRAFRSTAG